MKKTLGTPTTALVAITTQVDILTQDKASQVATLSAQPRNKGLGKTPVPPSTLIQRNKSGCM